MEELFGLAVVVGGGLLGRAALEALGLDDFEVMEGGAPVFGSGLLEGLQADAGSIFAAFDQLLAELFIAVFGVVDGTFADADDAGGFFDGFADRDEFAETDFRDGIEFRVF